MLGQKILILLIGTTVGMCHVIKYKSSEEHAQMEETAELTPFISHFLPPKSNFLYKPQFYISSPIAKIIEKDCQDTEVSHEHATPGSNFIDYISEAPFPTFIPDRPESIIVETIPPPVHVTPDCQDVASINIPAENVSLDINFEHKPIEIPQAPELPPLIMPELPSSVNVEGILQLPDYKPELPGLEIILEHKPIQIPLAPVLPPFIMPELPNIPEAQISADVNIGHKPSEIPQAPELPPLIIPDLPSSVSVEGILQLPGCEPEHSGLDIIQEHKPIQIPLAPELPPFIMPELPNIPEAQISVNINSEHKPIEIPQAPELPPLIIPQLPSSVSIAGILGLPDFKPELSGLDIIQEHKPIQIPLAPVLPPFIMPELPNIPEVQISADVNIGHKPSEIPQAPELPPLIIPDLPSSVSVEGILQLPDCKPEHPGLDTIQEHKPIQIPLAPELPPFIMPELPNIPEEQISVDINSEHKPVEIPQAPELPPLIIPQLTSSVNVLGILGLPDLKPELPGLELPSPVVVETKPQHPEFPEAPKVPECEKEEQNETVEVPEAPVLPPLAVEPLPEYPPEYHVTEYPHWSEIIPEGPSLQHKPLIGGISSQFAVSFPNYCAHTIILERVLPNMAANGELDVNRLNYPVFQYPAPTPHYTPVN